MLVLFCAACVCVSSCRPGSVFEEVCLRGRQDAALIGLHVFLDRFGCLKSVLDGLAVDRFGFRGFLAFVLKEALCLC